ncbi:MAG: phosphoribosylglycinamide formyltransferase [Planctomycetes bacterium B3_Pla]|nr:MAG: phosphoribosylglycinamide formyltransferase [Planctomycetes bacterium B3_Pla]
MPDKIVAHIDGGSRGNPGPAAAGFILADAAGMQLQAKGLVLGRATNNVAEYTGFVKALEAAAQIGTKNLVVFSDSELLVRQINGQYKVKSEQIRPLFQQAVGLLGRFESWDVRHVTRDKNKEADRLVNQALDLGHDVEDKKRPATPKGKPIRLGVLISGGGTTLMNILEHIDQGRLNAKVAVVISSLSKAGGVEKARNAGLKVEIVRKKDYPDIDQFSKSIEEKLTAENVDLVVQGGWLCLWKIPARYENRVMNIHPALLPSFGGRGMWGHHVHEAVLKAGCKISGCTVHFCTNEYDKGPIIVQQACEARSDDTPDTLAARVFEQECIAYPQAIKLFAEGKILVQNNVLRIQEELDDYESLKALREAKSKEANANTTSFDQVKKELDLE